MGFSMFDFVWTLVNLLGTTVLIMFLIKLFRKKEQR